MPPPYGGKSVNVRITPWPLSGPNREEEGFRRRESRRRRTPTVQGGLGRSGSFVPKSTIVCRHCRIRWLEQG